jgi:hypothetical protein
MKEKKRNNKEVLVFIILRILFSSLSLSFFLSLYLSLSLSLSFFSLISIIRVIDGVLSLDTAKSLVEGIDELSQLGEDEWHDCHTEG